MKSKVITIPESKEFKSITIQITAETIEDARSLWNIYNKRFLETHEDNYTVWEQIDNHIKSQGYEI